MAVDQNYGAENHQSQHSEHPEVRTTAETATGVRPTESVDTVRVPPSTSEAEARGHAWPDKAQPRDEEPDLVPHPGIPWKSLALSAVLSLIFGGLGAWGFERFLTKPTPPPEPATAQTPVKPVPPQQNNDKQIDALSKQVADLREQISHIHDQVLAESKNQPRHELKALANRVETLESKIKEDSGPNVKVDELNAHISSLDKSMETLRNEIMALRDGAGTSPSASTTRLATAKPSAIIDDDSDLGDDFSRGVAQFRKGQYSDALKAFAQAQTDHPDDARVWYYSALANGFSTKDWTGKAADLVTKGIEQERAGSPSAATIDDAFNSLTPATGKDWLAGYRKRAQ